MLRSFCVFLFAACAFVALTSCGGSKSDGTAEFATVFASVSPPNSNLDSDVATWIDATSGAKATVGCAPNAVASTVEDVVNFTLSSTAFAVPNTGSTTPITPSPLIITKITVTLNPANSLSPALPAIFQTFFSTAGQVIAPGAAGTAGTATTAVTTTVPVTLVSNQLKRCFRDPTALGNLAISCASNPIYSYYADVSFQAQEINTGRSATISIPRQSFIVNFSDFVDK